MLLRRLIYLFALSLALAFLGLIGRTVLDEWCAVQRAGRALHAVNQLTLALTAAEMVSRERGPTNSALGAESPLSAQQAASLQMARQRTDRAYEALPPVLAERDPDAQADERLLQALRAARAGVDAMVAQPRDQRDPRDIRRTVAAMVALVPMLAPTSAKLANAATQELPVVSDAVQGALLSAELRELSGQLGTHFTSPIARQQPFTVEERAAIERTRGRMEQLRILIELRVRLPGQSNEVRQAWRLAEENYFVAGEQLVAGIIASGQSDGRYSMEYPEFARRFVPIINTLFALRDVLMRQAGAAAQAESDRAHRHLLLTAATGTLLGGLLLFGMLALQRRLLRPLAGVTQALSALAQDDSDVPLPVPPAPDEMAGLISAVATLQQHSRERLALESERDSLIEQLRSLSITDFLTGLPNRRAFFEAADRDLAWAQRHGQEVVLVLLDVDHFKNFNDRHGHGLGDKALQSVAQALRGTLRGGDLMARFGGEEFVLMMKGCDADTGSLFAERLRGNIAATDLHAANGERLQVTASMGLADSACFGLDVQVLLSRADTAMYAAKAKGRNRVVRARDLHDLSAA